jgi:hypothetical protein
MARKPLGGECGFSLVELLLAGTVMSIGVAATLATFGTAGRATLRSQQHGVAVQQARAEVERIAALPYGSLALTASPIASSDPAQPGHRVEGSALRIRTGLSEAFVMTPGADHTARVDPGPQTFAVGTGGATITGKVYRYVTWRDEDCPGSLCEGTQDTKRVTVAVTVDPSSGVAPRRPVWLGTVLTNPNDAPPGSQSVPNGGPGGGEPVKAQAFYLYDTPCGVSTRQAPEGHHATRDTASSGSEAAAVSACEHEDGSKQPDLMGPTAPPGDNSTPLYEYSSDLNGQYPGGLAMLARGTSCATSYAAADAANPAGPSKWGVHAWSTGKFTQMFRLNGLVTLSLFTSTVGGAAGGGKLCATVVDRDTVDGVPADRILGSTVYYLASWPQTVRRVTFSFRLAQEEDLFPGHRLMVVMHLRGESDNDIAFLYDHPLYPSMVEVATGTPL